MSENLSLTCLNNNVVKERRPMEYASTAVGNADVPNALLTYSVDEAVNKAGYGKFQIRLTLISGIGWTADAFEIIILSVIGGVLACDWQISHWENALLTSVVFLGMMVGCPLFGYLADHYGRKKSLSVSMILLFVFGSLCAATPSIGWMMAVRALMGFSLGGVTQVMTLCSEYFPVDIRAKASFYLCYFWSAGTVGVILLFWVVMTQLDSWRVLLALTSVPSLIAVLCLWWVPESARYFLVSGQYDKAEAVLYQMATMNEMKLPLGRLNRTVTCEHRGSIRDLLNKEYRASTILFWFIWLAISFSYYSITLMTPSIVGPGVHKLTNSSLESTADLMEDFVPCDVFSTAKYVDLLWTSSAEFPGIVVCTFLVERYDRKKFMGFASILSGIFVFLLLIDIESAHIVRLIFLFGARGLIVGLFQLILVMTAETFPTTLRAMAIGTGSAWCRLGGLLSPFLAQVLIARHPAAAISVLATTLMLAGIAGFFLPRETRGAPMIETHDENETDKKSTITTISSPE